MQGAAAAAANSLLRYNGLDEMSCTVVAAQDLVVGVDEVVVEVVVSSDQLVAVELVCFGRLAWAALAEELAAGLKVLVRPRDLSFR